MFFIFLLFFLFSFLPQGESVDRQFRFREGFCQKNNLPGFNPEFFGECGNLNSQKFSNKKYRNSNLRGSIWMFAFVSDFEIVGGDMSFMNMEQAFLLRSSFEKIKADSVAMKGIRIQSVIWTKASLRNALAQASRIRKSQFIECDLRGANFWGSNLQETSFEKSDLRGANLQDTNLLFTSFREALFNNETKLPFSEEEALNRGMVKVD